MNMIKKFATGLLVTGAAVGMSLPAVLSPMTESIVFAADEKIHVNEGDAFEISAVLSTDTYNIYVKGQTSEMEILGEESDEDGSGSDYNLNLMVLLNALGEHEIVIEDGNGVAVKTLSVTVTSSENEDHKDEDGEGSNEDEGDQQNDSEDNPGNDHENNTGEAGENDNSGEKAGSQSDQVAFVNVFNTDGGNITIVGNKDEYKPGDKITLKVEEYKGYAFNGFKIVDLDGQDVTKDIGINEDNSFVLPDYPIRITGSFIYKLIHEIELLDVTEELEIGKPVAFTGHVKDKTDSRFFLLAEIWINEYDTKGITSSKDTNASIKKEGVNLLDVVDQGDKYNYSVMFMTTEGYEFADDVKLIYKGKEYKPTYELKDIDTIGKETVAFTGFLSFGNQINPKETKTITKKTTKQENRIESFTEYVYKTYTYTTYEYVTRTVNDNLTYKNYDVGTLRTIAASTGDTNNTAVWIALAVAAGGGVVSGILVGRRRKRK